MEEKKTKSEAKKIFWSSKSKEERKELTAQAVACRWVNVSGERRAEHARAMVKAREALKGQKLTVVD